MIYTNVVNAFAARSACQGAESILERWGKWDARGGERNKAGPAEGTHNIIVFS